MEKIMIGGTFAFIGCLAILICVVTIVISGPVIIFGEWIDGTFDRISGHILVAFVLASFMSIFIVAAIGDSKTTKKNTVTSEKANYATPCIIHFNNDLKRLEVENAPCFIKSFDGIK